MPTGGVRLTLLQKGISVQQQQFGRAQKWRRRAWVKIPGQQKGLRTLHASEPCCRAIAAAMESQCPHTHWCSYCKSNVHIANDKVSGDVTTLNMNKSKLSWHVCDNFPRSWQNRTGRSLKTQPNKRDMGIDLALMLAMAESAVGWCSAAILLAIRSGHEVPIARTVKAKV